MKNLAILMVVLVSVLTLEAQFITPKIRSTDGRTYNITWDGGKGIYYLQAKASLTNSWRTLDSFTNETATSKSFMSQGEMTNGMAFFQVVYLSDPPPLTVKAIKGINAVPYAFGSIIVVVDIPSPVSRVSFDISWESSVALTTARNAFPGHTSIVYRTPTSRRITFTDPDLSCGTGSLVLFELYFDVGADSSSIQFSNASATPEQPIRLLNTTLTVPSL